MNRCVGSGRAAEVDQEFDVVSFGQLVIILKDDRLAAVAFLAKTGAGMKHGIVMSVVGEPTEDDLRKKRDNTRYRRELALAASSKV